MAEDASTANNEEAPGQQTMFDAESGDKNRSSRKRGPAHLKGTQALERLRNRIDLAVKELHRLREENHSLQKELEGLRKGGGSSEDGTAVRFTESADDLRASLEQYIGTIDELIRKEEAASASEEA